MAAKWMKRLLAEENDDIVLLEKRNNFMKLLFLLAQYGYLAGPFSDLPPVRGLPPFPSFVEVSNFSSIQSCILQGAFPSLKKITDAKMTIN